MDAGCNWCSESQVLLRGAERPAVYHAMCIKPCDLVAGFKTTHAESFRRHGSDIHHFLPLPKCRHERLERAGSTYDDKPMPLFTNGLLLNFA